MQKHTNMTDIEIEEIYKKGDALVVEDLNCTAKYLHASVLLDILTKAKTHLHFVFVAACHSE